MVHRIHFVMIWSVCPETAYFHFYIEIKSTTIALELTYQARICGVQQYTTSIQLQIPTVSTSIVTVNMACQNDVETPTSQPKDREEQIRLPACC